MEYYSGIKGMKYWSMSQHGWISKHYAKRAKQKVTCLIPFIWCIQNRQIHKHTIHLWLPRAGRKGNGERLLIGMRISIHVSLIYLSIYRGKEISGSYGNFMFNFLRNCQTVFQSSCTILQSHQQSMRVPTSLYPCQHFYYFFLIIAIPLGVQWHLIMFF